MTARVLIGVLLLGGCLEADFERSPNGYFICSGDDQCPPDAPLCRRSRCYRDPPPPCFPFGTGPYPSCPEGSGCYIQPDEVGCFLPGAVPYGGSCDAEGSSCGLGLAGVNFDDGRCFCTKICHRDEDCVGVGGYTCSVELMVRSGHAAFDPPLRVCH